MPGTILGIGFVLAFSTPPLAVAGILYTLLALYLARTVLADHRQQWLALIIGAGAGIGLAFLNEPLGAVGLYYLLGGIYVAMGLFASVNGSPRPARESAGC